MTTFRDLPVGSKIQRALDDLNFSEPTPVQLQCFEPVLAKRDLLVQSQTGTGKTGAFAIPLLSHRVREGSGVQALVLAPTRELARQIAGDFEDLARHGDWRIASIYGGTPIKRQETELDQGVDVVVGTPGRVLDLLDRGILDVSGLDVLVLDEADEMLSMGFLEEISAIIERLPTARQTLLFSATLEGQIQRIAKRYMHDPELIELSGDQVGAASIEHTLYFISGMGRTRELERVLEQVDPPSAIIFCNTKVETEDVAGALNRSGWACDWLNGDLSQQEREKIMARTREGDLRLLVATDIAARGIDISHLTHVFNYSLPESPQQYIHRTGRTGRAGRLGFAVSLIGPKEVGSLHLLRQLYDLSFREKHLLTSREMETRNQSEQLELLMQRFTKAPHPSAMALTRRLLNHALGERIMGNLLSYALQDDRPLEQDESAASDPAPDPGAPPSESAHDASKRRPARNQKEKASARPQRKKQITPVRFEDVKSNGESRSRGDNRRGLNERDGDEKRALPQAAAPQDERKPREGYTEVVLGVGRQDRIKRIELIQHLQQATALSRAEIGTIRMRQEKTIVEVAEGKAEQVARTFDPAALKAAVIHQ